MAIRILNNNYGGRVSISSRGLGGRFQYMADPVRLLLNDYPGAAAAYSLRKLRTAYTGSAIRVRRSSDNTETDIGFVSNQLDTAAITTFVGAGNGFVTTWYDQSGNVNNTIQTTSGNQPQIVSSGAVITDLGKPTIQFLGTGYSLLSTTAVDPLFITAVNKPSTNSTYQTILGADTTDTVQVGAIYFQYGSPARTPSFARTTTNDTSGGNDFVASGASQVSNNVTNLMTGTRTSTSISLYLNGANVGNDTTSITLRPVGGTDSGKFRLMAGYYSEAVVDYLPGNLQEIILYTSNQSANRTAIETNINSYYSIY